MFCLYEANAGYPSTHEYSRKDVKMIDKKIIFKNDNRNLQNEQKFRIIKKSLKIPKG